MACGYMFLRDKNFKYSNFGILLLSPSPFLKIAVDNTHVTISQNHFTLSSNIDDIG